MLPGTIQLKNLSKSYSGLMVLEPLNLTFETGKTHIILGSSGCGKSTILRMLIGIISPSHGEIWIGEHLLTKESQPSLAVKMGYVTQKGGLFPHLTARQNVILKASLLKWSEAEIRNRLNDLVRMVGLDDVLLDHYPRELSGGQQQRVSLMRALMLDPPILALDEPLGALDPVVRRALQTELKGIFEKLGKTVILVTHDLAEAAYFGDAVTLLAHGKVIQTGTFSDLIHKPKDASVTEFIQAQRPIEEQRVMA